MAHGSFPTRHAIVIGGSIAGILAARVLADRFGRVTVVERDRLPDDPRSRRGTPQDRHIHALMAEGLRIMDRLFAGFDAELAAAGAPAGNVAADAGYFLPSGWAPRFESGLRFRAASRCLIEATLRRRLRAVGNVAIMERTAVAGLLAGTDGSVAGVRCGDGRTIAADLVVDASGRGSRAPDWLAALGVARPAEAIVNSSIVYVSARFRKPPGDPGWTALLVLADPAANPRYGAILPEEGGRWVVGLAGPQADAPAADADGVLAFAKRLGSPLVAEAIACAEPLGPPLRFRATMNRIRRYDAVRPWPERFVLLGDAVAVLNPIYGQGMTLAATGAAILGEVLADGGNRPGMAKRFQRRLAAANRIPWLLATGQDARHGGLAPLPTRAARLYTDRLMARIPGDRAIAAAFFEVLHFADPAAFLRPGIVARAVLPVRRAPAAISASAPPSV